MASPAGWAVAVICLTLFAISGAEVELGGESALGAAPKSSTFAAESNGIVFGGGMEIGWDYGENQMGLPPKSWGQLNDICKSGKRQSPINVQTKKAKAAAKSPASVRFQYVPTYGSVRNDGKSMIVDVSSNIANGVFINDQNFQLIQYRFHSPSEHQMDGRDYPLEMQMIHRNKLGKVVIVSVLFVTTDAVKDNPFLDSIWMHMPDFGSIHGAQLNRMSPQQGMPEAPSFFAYSGSLTTPPCHEKVLWMVMKQASVISFGQILKLRKSLRLDDRRSMRNGNARPLKPLGQRSLHENDVPKAILKDVQSRGCQPMIHPEGKLSPAKLHQSCSVQLGKLQEIVKREKSHSAKLAQRKNEATRHLKKAQEKMSKSMKREKTLTKEFERTSKSFGKSEEQGAKSLAKSNKAAQKDALKLKGVETAAKIAKKNQDQTASRLRAKLKNATATGQAESKKLKVGQKTVLKDESKLQVLKEEKKSKKALWEKNMQLEKDKAKSQQQVSKAEIKALKERLTQMRAKISKHKEAMQALKASTVAKKTHEADKNKIQVAHRKEITAIKIANKEQLARLAAQHKQKSEKLKEQTEKKMVKKFKQKMADVRTTAKKRMQKMEKQMSTVRREAEKKGGDAKMIMERSGKVKKAQDGKNAKAKKKLAADKAKAEKERVLAKKKVEAQKKKLAGKLKKCAAAQNQLAVTKAKMKMMKKIVAAAEKGKIAAMKKLKKKMKKVKAKMKAKVKGTKKSDKKELARLKAKHKKLREEMVNLRLKLGKLMPKSAKLKKANRWVKAMRIKIESLKKKLANANAKAGAGGKGGQQKGGESKGNAKETKSKSEIKALNNKLNKMKLKMKQYKKSKNKATNAAKRSEKNAKKTVHGKRTATSKLLACQKKEKTGKKRQAKFRNKMSSMKKQTQKAVEAQKKQFVQTQKAVEAQKKQFVLMAAQKKTIRKAKKKNKELRTKLKHLQGKGKGKSKGKGGKDKKLQNAKCGGKVSKLKTQLKDMRARLRRMKRRRTGKGSGPKGKNKGKKTPPRVSATRYKYKKYETMYKKCKVKSAFALKNFDQVTKLKNKFKNEKWVCLNKLQKLANKPKYEPGPK